MVNMAVSYIRPDYAASTLANEITSYWPGRQADLGYVTGYKAPGNFSGHNADSNGICHAVDIGTYISGDINEPDGRNIAEQLRLIGARTNRFQYLIHDMGTEAQGQVPMIAGIFNGWVWQPYAGTDKHSSHIHVSICDLYWGDPAPIPASVYDSTAPWGITRGGVVSPAASHPVAGKSIAQLVNETIAGLHGNGPARQASLGANYNAVQAEINRRAGAPAAKPQPVKSISQLADETIAGMHGNGPARQKALGANYNAVQAEINRRAGVHAAKPAVKSIVQLANETIAGLHGNGPARQKALGANYNAVQAEINRRSGIKPASGPSISQLADRALRGDFGNGPARQRALGANYNAVQAEINRRMGV